MAEFEVNISPENRVYAKPRLITDNTMHYCPGCSHGVIHKLVAEVIDEMGWSTMRWDFSGRMLRVGLQLYRHRLDRGGPRPGRRSRHGRQAPQSVETRVYLSGRRRPGRNRYRPRRSMPATGGENITIIFVNNAIYGMTGGQMAPTTPLPRRMRTATTPRRPRPEAARLSV